MWTPQKVVFLSSRHPFSYFNARDLFGKTGFRLIILTELNITGTSVCEWTFSFTTGFICFTRGINSHSVRTADELCDLTCPRRVQLNLGVSVGGFFFYNLSKPTSSSRQSTWTNVSSVSVMFESSQPFLVILCVSIILLLHAAATLMADMFSDFWVSYSHHLCRCRCLYSKML